MRSANYIIVDNNSQYLTIRDLGPHNKYSTITNDAEGVIRQLYNDGFLKEGQRLLYYDSEGILDELLWEESGVFKGFRPFTR